MIPFIALSGKLSSKAQALVEDGTIPGGEIVQENVANLKTVRAMNCLDNTLLRFDKEVETRCHSF